MVAFRSAVFMASILVCIAMPAAGGCKPEVHVSAERFVSAFYNDYIQTSKKDSQDSIPWAKALSSVELSAELARALRSDYIAQMGAVGEVVGIDFDPFLYTQDPAAAYTLGRTECEQNRCHVRLKSDEVGMATSLIVSVESRRGCWEIIDIEYPGGGNLRAILKALREQRAR